MHFPKITIVTPVFNLAGYIEETIQSILNQNYPNLEYIIIDGGSTDGTIDIIKKYENHLAFWKSEKDNGLYEAIQKGFDKSSGEIMAWLNADDLYHKGALSIVAEIYSTFDQVEWLTGIPSSLDTQGRCIKIMPFRKWSKYNYYRGDYDNIQTESTFWRRSLWDKGGKRLDTKLKLAGDFELWMRFFQKGAKLYSVNSLLGGFRFRKEQLTYKNNNYLKEINQVISRLNFSKEEIRTIWKMKFYENILLKVFYLRGVLELNKQYERLYDYPESIFFDLEKFKFTLI